MKKIFLSGIVILYSIQAYSPCLHAQETLPSDLEQSSSVEETDTSSTEEQPTKEVANPWPYQEPLFAIYAKPQTRVGLGLGFASNPEVNSLAFVIKGSFAFLDAISVHIRMPLGLSMNNEMGNQFTFGDPEIGAQWLIASDPQSKKHLSVGLNIIGPLSRVGEEKDLSKVSLGQVEDSSNFGKRYLLAQKPLLDMGLVPKLNIGIVPQIAFGQNIGRVSLQTDFGCMILVMDNVGEEIYGTDRRLGFVLFYDLAVPVSITEEFVIVSEFNATLGLDDVVGTGFALTIGPRYTTSGFSIGAGVQLPIGVDNDPPDDDKMVGRFDSAMIVRHQIAAILDLSYAF